MLMFGFFFLVSCKEEPPEKKHEDSSLSEVPEVEIYVCPSECENGMNYYLEGKCDICHHNLVKKK